MNRDSSAWWHSMEPLNARITLFKQAHHSIGIYGASCQPCVLGVDGVALNCDDKVAHRSVLYICMQRRTHVPAAGKQVNTKEETDQNIDDANAAQCLQPLPQWTPWISEANPKLGNMQNATACRAKVIPDQEFDTSMFNLLQCSWFQTIIFSSTLCSPLGSCGPCKDWPLWGASSQASFQSA